MSAYHEFQTLSIHQHSTKYTISSILKGTQAYHGAWHTEDIQYMFGSMKQLVQVTALARGKVRPGQDSQPSAAASVSPSPSSVTQVRLILQGGWSGGGRRVWIYGWGSVRSSCSQSSCIARYVQINNAPSPPIYVGLHPHNL